MGGGSSGGGGGGSGAIVYPAHMSVPHATYLNDMRAQLTTAWAANPYTAASAYDPATPIADMVAAVAAYEVEIDGVDPITDWQSFINAAYTYLDANVLDDEYITDQVTAFSAILDDDVLNKILPRFEAGMLDINAVNSFALSAGRALIWDARTRDVAKYASDLQTEFQRLRASMIDSGVKVMSSIEGAQLEHYKALANYDLEVARMTIVALKEQVDKDLEIDALDAMFDLNSWQTIANMMASIGGGTAAGGGKPSQAQTALGTALSGAAIGATVGGGPGAIVGGILGAGAGLLAG